MMLTMILCVYDAYVLEVLVCNLYPFVVNGSTSFTSRVIFSVFFHFSRAFEQWFAVTF